MNAAFMNAVPNSPPLSSSSPLSVDNGIIAGAGLARQYSNSGASSSERKTQSLGTGSPGPYRRDASLLSISREPLAAPSLIGGPLGTSETSSGYSSIPRPLKYHSLAVISPSTAASGSGSEYSSSPSGYGYGSAPDTASPETLSIKQSVSPQLSPTSSLSRSPKWNTTSVRPSASISGHQLPSVIRSSSGSSGSGSMSSIPGSLGFISPPQSSSANLSTGPFSFEGGNQMSPSRAPLTSRGAHGRSDSVSLSMPLGGGSGGSGNHGLSSSPSTSFRTFPSAPPLALSPHSSPSTGFTQLPGGAAISPRSTRIGISPSSSVSSNAFRPEGGGIKLQRVPTSVRLAQDLHPQMSAMSERRRTSIDAAFALSPAGFKLGDNSSSSGSGTSSETEKRSNKDRHGHANIKLPATPMVTRQNTPSPTVDLLERVEAPGSPKLLASPFPASPSARGLALATPASEHTSAFAPLFPFSIPSSSSFRPSTTSPSVSRSHSRTRSKGSPLHEGVSPKIRQGPSATTGPTSVSSTPSAKENSSPNVSQYSADHESIINIVAADTSDSLRNLEDHEVLPTAYTLVSDEIADPLFTSPGIHNLSTDENIASSDRKKIFRTSMMPGPSTDLASSSEEYARHLQESRASKLRKWANNLNEDVRAGAGSTISGSDFAGSTIKERRRAGMPDFSIFGFSASPSGDRSEHRRESSEDWIVPPGTAGSREIEWVDWLDEYKKMKQAKIRAEQDHSDVSESLTLTQSKALSAHVAKTDVDAVQDKIDDHANSLADRRLSGDSVEPSARSGFVDTEKSTGMFTPR